MNTAGIFEKPDGIYALSHSVGPLIKSASTALQTQYLATWAKQGGDAWPHWLAQIDSFCKVIGEVVNAPAHLICPQVNLASGFYGFLTAITKLASHKHQSTILMHKDAFASMGFVVTGLAKTFNLKLHLIEGDPNDIETWYTAFESQQVLACLVTHVHSNTSVKSNVAEICKIAKQFEAFACVDIAQSAGIVPVDVMHWQADAVFGSCVKWLCGGPGAGFMYIKEILLNSLEPDPIGWFSHQNPFEFDITHYVAAQDAKRFWGGTPSIAPYVMATESIKALLALQLPKVAKHNALMKEIMAETLPEHKTYAEIKRKHSHFGGSLCIAANEYAKTQKKLAQYNVKYDCRGNVFRLSLHVINTEQEARIIGECFT
jgi:kynureninase